MHAVHLVALGEVGVAGKALGAGLGLGQQDVVVGEALRYRQYITIQWSTAKFSTAICV